MPKTHILFALLPGGNNDVYMLFSVATAGDSIWWFGWFDRIR